MSSNRLRRGTALLVCLLGLAACGITSGPTGGNGCATFNCPPPALTAQQAHQVIKTHFTFQYFDPWSEQSGDANSVVVGAATNFGDLTVQVASVTVSSGTSAQALLQSEAQNLNTAQISGLQDQGPIYGAAIGYVAGAGETYTGTVDQPNAPSVPVYLELMSSVRGTVGIVFLASSSLNPNSPDNSDPRQVPNGEYDRMVNSLVWR